MLGKEPLGVSSGKALTHAGFLPSGEPGGHLGGPRRGSRDIGQQDASASRSGQARQRVEEVEETVDLWSFQVAKESLSEEDGECLDREASGQQAVVPRTAEVPQGPLAVRRRTGLLLR